MFNASMKFDLGEDVNALRDMVHRWAQERVKPLAAEIDRDERLSRRAVARDGRSGPAGHHGARGIWRRRYGLSGACRRGRGNRAGLGLVSPVLRRAFEPLRQPDQAERHRCAEGEIPAAAGLGRACRRAGDERGGGGVGRGVDEAAGREAQRSLPAERHEILDHQRAGCRYAGGLCQDRPGGRHQGHHRLPDRKVDEGVLDQLRISTSWGCAGRTPPS